MLESTGHNSKRLETLGSAAAGIAHDINNQLTLILNYLELSDLQGARAAAARCSALTASLLSYCRGDSPALQPIPMAAFLRSFVETLKVPSGVRWSLELQEPLPDIRANPLAITRVLTNLIGNACDAMENQGSLCIKASPRLIEIQDSGPGIPAARLSRIFEPFYSTKGSYGTGLGLAIVREIMRQHGGSVTVSSEPGKGATFTLHFR